MNSHRILKRRIRTRKEDSAFVYCIFESYEGIVSYSTVDYKPSTAHRDLELTIPECFVDEVDAVIKELGELIYVITE